MRTDGMYSKEGFFMTETRVVVNEFFEFESSILPSAPHHLEREIIVKQGAKVIGDIAGGLVIIGQNVEVLGSIICDNLRVGAGSKIEGGMYVRFEVELEPDVEVGTNVFGEVVRIGVRGKVGGHVMGLERVDLEDGVSVGGLAFSHDFLRMHDLCEVKDLLAVGNINIGSNTIIHDSTIWSIEGEIEYVKNNTLNARSDKPVLLEDSVHALRKLGTELTALLPEGYYYVHSVSKDLDDRFDEISQELLQELEEIVEVDLPIGNEDRWIVRTMVKSVDIDNIKSVIDDSGLYDSFENIVTDLIDRVTGLSDKLEDLYVSGGDS